MKTFEYKTQWGSYTCFLEYYEAEHLISVMSVDKDGFVEPFMTATAIPPREIRLLQENEVAIKNYSENEGILDTLVNLGVITPPVLRLVVNAAFNVCLELCRVTPMMAEYTRH